MFGDKLCSTAPPPTPTRLAEWERDAVLPSYSAMQCRHFVRITTMEGAKWEQRSTHKRKMPQ
ncbi:hypothetical protein E2C01_068140 [Portunus trituberculatus]|uniref:Uncharacterized protein n=1 Tax=Portunus trituberculatus TaxID=210409 RepID=A0A5B7HR64_PORTR|nr:hypothetical protein [Portunus trituberculatus]